ncbi:MAG TPA: hypothetical protein VFS36_08000 [Chitinophagaceae bacterium]|nr:hypothetical protein [Chitinophagaceae bacterium]
MKRHIILIIFCLMILTSQAQVTNSSYVNNYGEKVLQLSIIVPLDKMAAWELFTTDEGLKKWIAPVAKIDMKVGGSIITNYDKTKTIEDSTSIKLDIINYIQQELLTLKVNLNNNFPPSTIREDKNLQEVIQFISAGKGRTKIVSNMIGWGHGSDWDKVYAFFEKGNTWTYEEVLKLFKKQQ